MRLSCTPDEATGGFRALSGISHPTIGKVVSCGLYALFGRIPAVLRHRLGASE